MQRIVLVLLLASLSFLGACGGGSGGGPGGGEGPAASDGFADVVVGSVSTLPLFAVHAGVEEVRLVDENGGRTANLLPSAASVELVGAEERATWLSRARLPQARYTGLEVVFDPDRVEVTETSGNRTAALVPDPRWSVELDAPLTVASGSVERLLIELDLDASIQNPTGSGTVFAPDGEVEIGVPATRPIEDFGGLVVETSPRERTVTIDAVVTANVPVGLVEVTLGDDTVLVDDTGVVFPDEDAFFASLRVGLTVLDVHGVLGSTGTVTAERIRIVDQAGGQGRPPVVEIEGMVLHVDEAAGFFVLLIREIEKGADDAEPVLAGLGDPSSIDVDFDGATRFERSNGAPASAGDLAAGRIVDVEFSEFSKPPFVADVVQLESPGVCVSGEIVDVSDLPQALVMVVEDRGATGPGSETSGGQRMLVDLSDADIYLNLRGRPRLDPSELVPGLRAKACGELSDLPEGGLVLHPEWLRVKPGHLIRGHVGEADPVRSLFVVDHGKIVQSFGDPVTDPPFAVRVDERTR